MASGLIRGVDRTIVEQFLELFRDRYPAVEDGNYWLSRTAGAEAVGVGIANTRDALSHFVTILSNTQLTSEEQLQQLNHAEEHLRRAALEPYAIAARHTEAQLRDDLPKYVARVLPLIGRPELSSARSYGDLMDRIREFQDLRRSARASKARNRWDDAWMKGVEQLTAAYLGTSKLHEEMKDQIEVAHQVRRRLLRNSIAYWGLTIALISIGLTLLLSLPTG